MLLSIVIVLVVLGLAATTGIVAVSRVIHICQPNEVLVFSGVRRREGDRLVGYRVVQGGRGLCIPMLETVDRLDLTNLIIDVRVEGAYSRGGIPLNVNAVANIKIASSEPIIGNAIERFLGKPRRILEAVAKETLEGNLRGVLATLTPEEVNQDRVKFAQSLLHEADTDLKKLGLVLDTLKIQNVSDDKGYLDSLGRKQSAQLQMRSRVAEAENRAISAENDAANFEIRSFAKLEAEVAVARADAARRIVDALTKREALVAEARVDVGASVVRVEAEVAVQKARLEQVRLRLEADEIKSAEAERDRRIVEARGAMASIVEDGKATARSIREVADSWNRSGSEARRIFVAQRLSTFTHELLGTVDKLSIDNVTLVDERLHVGEEGGNNRGRKSLATSSRVAATELSSGLGIDVTRALQGLASLVESRTTTTDS